MILKIKSFFFFLLKRAREKKIWGSKFLNEDFDGLYSNGALQTRVLKYDLIGLLKVTP